ncbi:hypothetical protein SH449x_004088 [Pirellulaceae bacterium SH449]
MSTATESELIEFVRSYREPFPISMAATELHHLGNLGADWPKASYEHWVRELEQLVDKGLLDLTNGCLTVARVESLVQKSLFD